MLDDPQTRRPGAQPPGVEPPGASRSWRAVVRVLRSQTRTAFDALTASVFPASCSVCELPLSSFSRAPVCAPCLDTLAPQFGILCLHCGEALGAHPFASSERAPGDWLCRPCRMVPPAFDRAVAFGLYQGRLRQLIHLLKYEGMAPLAAPLGVCMAGQLAALPGIPTSLMVVPVPLFRGKQSQRGFNQAALLARAVAHAGRTHGLVLKVREDLLVRTRATQSQAQLSPAGRRRNVQGAFAVSETAAALVAGQNVLLVDDVFTTGATARAASAALRRAGAKEIWVSTAARAQRFDLVQGVESGTVPMEEDVAHWN